MAVCVVSGERRINELLMNSDPLTHPPFKLMRSLQLVFGTITLATAAYVVSVSSYWYVVRAYDHACSLLFFYSFMPELPTSFSLTSLELKGCRFGGLHRSCYRRLGDHQLCSLLPGTPTARGRGRGGCVLCCFPARRHGRHRCI